MRVGEDEADSTLTNALSPAAMFALTREAAIRLVRDVVAVVDTWQAHFASCGVTPGDSTSTPNRAIGLFSRISVAIFGADR